MFALYLLIVAAIAYLFGGINGAIISSKYIFKKDIRKYGSGNPGLTNFYRVFGKKGALLLIAIDILKTAIPVLIGLWIFRSRYDMSDFGAAFAGFFAMLGHAFPIYYGFKGGKTVLSGVTVVMIVDWRAGLIALGVFITVLIITKYVSLGSVLGALMYPIFAIIFGLGFPTVIMAIISIALLVFRHRENIKRLIAGKESKFSFSGKGKTT